MQCTLASRSAVVDVCSDAPTSLNEWGVDSAVRIPLSRYHRIKAALVKLPDIDLLRTLDDEQVRPMRATPAEHVDE